MDILFFKTGQDAFLSMTDRLITLMQEKGKVPFHLALSGGGTAQLLFNLWNNQFKDRIDWNRLRFYWVDERCVPPSDNESNFKHAEDLLFRPLGIPPSHIFRIHGEDDPEQEAVRYSSLVRKDIQEYDDVPLFDCIILGIGDDFHTASIFPSNMNLLTDERFYAESVHPVSGQRRVTMTGTLILNAMAIFVPVVGQSKTHVVEQLLHNPGLAHSTPAGYILSRSEEAIVFTDCVL